MFNGLFSEGLEVYYKHQYGIIRFVCDEYITVCVRNFPRERVKDVCIVVHPENYKYIELIKESTK